MFIMVHMVSCGFLLLFRVISSGDELLWGGDFCGLHEFVDQTARGDTGDLLKQSPALLRRMTFGTFNINLHHLAAKHVPCQLKNKKT